MRGAITLAYPFLALLFLTHCSSESPVFEQLPASATGIDFINHIQEDDDHNVFKYMNIYTGAGVAAGDINNDGLTDLYFSGNMVSGRLYLNLGQLRFNDITLSSGLDNDSWGTGAAMVDINQDGWLDIYVTVSGSASDEKRRNLLYVNNHDSTFTERGKEFGIADTRQTMHSAFLDYDKDGDLDLFLLINPAAYEYNVNVVQPRRLNGESISTDVLYRNNGDGTFEDVSDSAGLLVEGYGLGVAVSDINQDGWPDLYISNDFIGNDILYINNADGTFSNQAASYLKHTSYAGMGNDVSDFNNDGLVDIMVLDMRPEDNLRQKLIISSRSYDQFQLMLESGYEPQYGRNTLQLNQGAGNFSEIGFLSGVSSTDWSWSALFGDYDNDGDRDLFVTNGFLRDLGDLDYIHYQRVYDTPFGEVAAKKEIKRAAIRSLPGAAIRDYLFENNGDLTFSDKSAQWGIKELGYSNGAAYADLDNDGDLELVVNNINGEAHFYHNRSEQFPNRNYIRVRLVGKEPNRNGLGSQLWVWTSNGLQYYQHYPFRGYESSVDPVIHFGLDSVLTIDSIRISWPQGSSQVLKAIRANQLLVINQEEAQDLHRGASPRKSIRFMDEVGDSLGIAFKHVEDNQVDFKSQPILPHSRSQEGPGIAVGDLNGDGLEDFYVGGATGFSGYLYFQDKESQFQGRPLGLDSLGEDMGVLFFDADLDNDLDLYVVSGGTSFPEESAEYQDRLYLNDGSGGFTRTIGSLPEILASGSCVVAADYDRDGDLDLFVGGRVLPRNYPMPAQSYILRNDLRPSGQGETPNVLFSDVTEQVAPGLANAGMVTSALWTDYDNDGWVDLIVAGEFMPIKLYRNIHGEFEDQTVGSGLEAHPGWWNGLAAADFDKDGDMDYLAGNLGLNSRYQATPEEPLCIYASDYDKDGRLDPVMCYYIDGENYISHSRDDIIAQINPMRARFKTYREYAEVTFDRAFLPSELEEAYVVKSTRFESSYIENLGGGKFSMSSLPVEAQVSPIYGMTILDYNHDGYPDVLLAGNSYATEVTTGRYDASVGLCLQGDGQGGFSTVTWERTGFLVDGDTKGMAHLRSANNVDLHLVATNSGRLRAFREATIGGPSYAPKPLDASALITWKDSSIQKEEFGYGSSYLSHSSRILDVSQEPQKIEITGYNGEKRLLDWETDIQ